jgi:CHASE3 domain sensor protein
MPSSSNLRRNLPLWGFGIALAVLLIGVLTGYRNAQRLIANERLAAHSDDAIVDLTRLLSGLRDIDRRQRGYLLTGNPAYPQAFRQAAGLHCGRVPSRFAAISRELRCWLPDRSASAW